MFHLLRLRGRRYATGFATTMGDGTGRTGDANALALTIAFCLMIAAGSRHASIRRRLRSAAANTEEG
jgi:hypothetical protein